MLIFTCENIHTKIYIEKECHIMATKKKSTASTKRGTTASTKRGTTAKRNNKREKPNPKYRATLSVYGEVQSVYEGEQAMYLTIKVWNDSEYYSLINITVDYDLADEHDINEGDEISILAGCSSFFEKRSQRVVPIFTAFEIVPLDEDDDEDDEDDDEDDG